MVKPSNNTLDPASAALAMRHDPPKDLSFDQALAGLSTAGDIVPISEFGSGFDLVDSKSKGQLVGVPFIILDWRLNEGDFGNFATMQIITKDNRRLIVNDGSSGIRAQLEAIAKTGVDKAIYVKKGLRASNFEYTDPKTGEKKPATTYYLDTSA